MYRQPGSIGKIEGGVTKLGFCWLAIAACMLSLFWTAPAGAQQTGIRANPPTYVTYNNTTSAYDTRAEAININVNNPPLSNYAAIAAPPPGQFSFVQTSDGVNLMSALFNQANGQLLNTIPNAGGGLAANQTFGGLVDARAWNAADITMQQCFSGGFSWNIQGSLRPSAGVGVANTIPYTFAAAANFNEFSYEAQAPNANAPNSGAGATTALGNFSQGHTWSDWNTAALPANNSLARYRSYQVGVSGAVIGGVTQGGDPFTNGNATTAWGNINFYSLATKAFESPIYASSDALAAGGGVNAASANNGRTLTQVAANPTYAVLLAFSATNDNRFVLDLERQYVSLLSDGIPANHIAVLYGDGTVGQLKSFPSIVAANQQPNFSNIYTAGFTMPVNGAVSSANVAGLLDGTGWAGLGLAAPPAGANLYLYTTGHGGAVNVGGVPIAVNNAGGNALITNVTLAGPPNPSPKTTLQIASNSALPASVMSDSVMVDGNMLPTDLVPDPTPFDVTGLDPADGTGAAHFYYDVSVPQSDFTTNSDGTYTFSLEEAGGNSSADISQFDSSLVAVTMLDDSASLGSTDDLDTYTDLVSVPEPSAVGILMLAAGATLTRRSKRARDFATA